MAGFYHLVALGLNCTLIRFVGLPHPLFLYCYHIDVQLFPSLQPGEGVGVRYLDWIEIFNFSDVEIWPNRNIFAGSRNNQGIKAALAVKQNCVTMANNDT